MSSSKKAPIRFFHNTRIAYEPDNVREMGEAQFWIVETKKTKEETKETYKFLQLGLEALLRRAGVGRYELPESGAERKTIYVCNHDNVIREITAADIRDYAVRIADKTGNDQLREMIRRGAASYFADAKLGTMQYIDLNFLRSSAKRQYFLFANQAVEITERDIRSIPYSQLDGAVWEQNIANYTTTDIKPGAVKIIRNADGEYEMQVSEEVRKHDFWRYLEYTSCFHWRKLEEPSDGSPKADVTDAERRAAKIAHISKLSALGYLLTSYKDRAAARAVICMDARMSEVGASNGRSGKSLFGYAVMRMLHTYYINGRDTKNFDGSFPFDGLNNTHRLIMIDDADQNFNFGLIYNNITGDFQVNTKGLIKFTIPFESSPKFLITTNHAIRGNNASDLDRQFLLGFSDYFSDQRKPTDVFGRRLFDEWSASDWNIFWQISAAAVQIYLEYGFIIAETESLALRKLRQEIGETFISWADGYFQADGDETLNIGIELNKQEAYAEFEMLFPNYCKRFCDIRIFKKKLIDYAKFKGYIYNVEKNGSDIKKGGKEFFTLHRPEDLNKPNTTFSTPF